MNTNTQSGSWLLVAVPLGVAMNLAIGLVVTTLKLPIFLHAIGTIVCTLLMGWRIGATVGVLSFLVGGLFNPVLPYFVLTQFTIACVAGGCATYGGFKNLGRTILTGIAIGYAAAIVSAPVIAIVFGGITTSGESLVTAFFVKTGQNLWSAVATTKVWTEPLDKVLQSLAAYSIVKGLPKVVLSRFEGRGYLGKNGLSITHDIQA